MFLGADSVGSFISSYRNITLEASSVNFRKLDGSELGATGTFNTANSSILKVKNGLVTDWE